VSKLAKARPRKKITITGVTITIGATMTIGITIRLTITIGFHWCVTMVPLCRLPTSQETRDRQTWKRNELRKEGMRKKEGKKRERMK
jgi:hypothetical protein